MIGERLALVRKDHGETQADLAKYLNVSLPAVRSWEQDRNAPNDETVVLICRHYNVCADYLLGLTDNDINYHIARRKEHFSEEEQKLIRQFEDFLKWKRQQ